jgi:hypothetical protein
MSSIADAGRNMEQGSYREQIIEYVDSVFTEVSQSSWKFDRSA